jgi:hypothetical protein
MGLPASSEAFICLFALLLELSVLVDDELLPERGTCNKTELCMEHPAEVDASYPTAYGCVDWTGS